MKIEVPDSLYDKIFKEGYDEAKKEYYDKRYIKILNNFGAIMFGLMSGVFLTIIFLMFMKYISS